jgi:hypothetical protein
MRESFDGFVVWRVVFVVVIVFDVVLDIVFGIAVLLRVIAGSAYWLAHKETVRIARTVSMGAIDFLDQTVHGGWCPARFSLPT